MQSLAAAGLHERRDALAGEVEAMTTDDIIQRLLKDIAVPKAEKMET